jgi:hypothetical protein
MLITPHVADTEGTRWDTGCEDEITWWPRVMWVDPGVVSGVSIIWFHPAALYAGVSTTKCILAWWESYLRGPEDDQTCQLTEIVKQIGGPSGLAIGVETWIMQQMNQSQDFLSPVRLRAKIEYALYKGLRENDGQIRRRTIQGQSASEAKNAINDQRLKLMGMYTPGPDHVRDSTRHCVLWIRKLRNRGTVAFRAAHGWEKEWFE